MATTSNTIQLVVDSTTLLTILAPFVIGIIAWLTKMFRKIKGLPAAVESIKTVVDTELKYNGGKSVKDLVGEIAQSLSKQEAWASALQDQLRTPLWRADHEGNFEWVNLAFTQETGMGLEHLRGLLWLGLVSESDRGHVEACWSRSVRHASVLDVSFRSAPGDDYSPTFILKAQPFFSSPKHGSRLLGFAGTLQTEDKK